MAVVKDRSQTIGEFLDWLKGRKRTPLVLCHEEGFRYWPSATSEEQLLAEFFEIDLNKAEEEKRAMLDAMREARHESD